MDEARSFDELPQLFGGERRGDVGAETFSREHEMNFEKIGTEDPPAEPPVEVDTLCDELRGLAAQHERLRARDAADDQKGGTPS